MAAVDVSSGEDVDVKRVNDHWPAPSSTPTYTNMSAATIAAGDFEADAGRDVTIAAGMLGGATLPAATGVIMQSAGVEYLGPALVALSAVLAALHRVSARA